MVSLRNEQFRLASVVTCVKPTRSRRIGEPVENRRSSQAASCNKRCVMNAGDPSGSKGGVWSLNRYKREGSQKAAGESDHLMVLRDGRAHHPNCWSGEIRNWELPEQVWLNPEKEQSELNQAA